MSQSRSPESPLREPPPRAGWVGAAAILAIIASLAGCTPEIATAPEARLDLHVRGGRLAHYVVRVRRADGSVVSERTATAAGQSGGERLRVSLPCEPLPNQQPNRVELSFDPPAPSGDAGELVPLPSPIEIPFDCDAATVSVPHELLLAYVDDDTLRVGNATCSTLALTPDPALGGPYRVAEELRCDGPSRLVVAHEPPRLLCNDADHTEVDLPSLANADHLSDAFPEADVALATDGAGRTLRAALEPLMAGVDCALVTEIRLREQDSPGTRPILTWRLDAAGSHHSLAYATPPPEPPPAPAALTATATWDGALLDVDIPLPPALAHPATPASGLSLAVTTDDGAHAWSIHVTASDAVALRDDAPTPVDAALHPGGRAHFRLPAGPGALVIAPLRHADGPLGRPLAWTGSLPERPAADDAPLPVPLETVTDEVLPLLGLPSPSTPGAPVLLEGLFPAPLDVRVGAASADLAQTATTVAFTWPDDAAPTDAVDLNARWAPLAPNTCGALCLSGVTTPATPDARHLTPPLITPNVDAALVARALDGDPALATTPLRVGAARVVAFATGRATCLASRGDDAPVRLVAGDTDGHTVLATDTPGLGTDRFACAPGSRDLTATDDDARDAVDVRTSPAGVVLATPADGPRVVTVTVTDTHVDLVLAGFAPSDAPTLSLGADDLPLTPTDYGWRAALPTSVRSGFANAHTADAETPPVWLALPGSDRDGDGIDDGVDGCPRAYDADQDDQDGDGLGDACDADSDGDGWDDRVDRCPAVPDADQRDADGDGAGAACDFDDDDPTEQRDSDGDGFGDNLERARCGDGALDRELGEQCDDGNTVPHDGCEADCLLPCGVDAGAVRAVFDTASGHCLLALPDRADFAAARDACELVGGHLAIPDDEAENLAVYAAASFRQESAWLGIDDLEVEGVFLTLAGVEPGFTAWGSDEPSSAPGHGIGVDKLVESCVALERASPSWRDADCSQDKTVVCERAPEPCGDGVPERRFGEACDDGDDDDGDGCTSACELGCPAVDWTSDPSGVLPAAGVYAALRDPVTGHCLVNLAPTHWDRARERCADLGGHLWVPDDPREADLGQAFSARESWIGVSMPEQVGHWWTATGHPVTPTTFTRWDPGFSDTFELRCALQQGDGRWRADGCDRARAAICEVETPSCGDGVIQPARGETCDPGAGDLGIGCVDGCQTALDLPNGSVAFRRDADGHHLVRLPYTVAARDAAMRCEATGGYVASPDDPEEVAATATLGRGWRGVNLTHEPWTLLNPKWETVEFVPLSWPALNPPIAPLYFVTAMLMWQPPSSEVSAPLLCEVEPTTCGDGVVQVARGEACDGEGRGCGPDCAAACDVDAELAARSPSTGRCIIGREVPAETPAADIVALCAEVGAIPYAPLAVDEDRIAADYGRRAWIGVDDSAEEGRYVGPDGTPVELTFWDLTQPNDVGSAGADCVVMEPWGAWNDVTCATPVEAVLCARADPACGDGREDDGELCDDGDLVVEGNDCDCPIACAGELAPRAAYLELGGQCAWASAESMSEPDARAYCEAAGGFPMRTDDRWRRDLARRLGGGWVAGSCNHVTPTGALFDACDASTPALCERAPDPCGDGHVQRSVGEQCDDGNRDDDDGCDGDCTLPCGAEVGAEAAVRATSGACFFRLPGRDRWEQAVARCVDAGAHLAIPDGAVENDAVMNLGGGWLGVSDREVEGSWMTVLSEALAFERWARGETEDPAGSDCAAMLPDVPGQWRDVSCSELREVICEAP